jgi:hypothetical protein
MTSLRTTLLALPLAGLLALAPESAAAQDQPKQDQPKFKKERDRVTREEILASAQKDADLYTAVRALRPRFLEPPPGLRSLSNGAPPTLVVIDGNRQPGLDVMRSVMANAVAEVRYMEPSRAQNEYGMSGGSGAVVIKMFKADKNAQKVTKDSTP